MNDFLIAFGTLWVFICAYAILAYNIKAGDADAESPMPSYVSSASLNPHPREERRNSRHRLHRCARRSPAVSRSSRR